MPGFSITLDTKRLDQKMKKLRGPLLPKVMVRTLNDLAFKGRQGVQQDLPSIFDAPTPFTVRGVRYQKATLQRPESAVFMSDEAAKGTPAGTYLQPQAKGGQRRQKRSERAMERAGILGRNEGWVPGKALRLNRYGNVTGPRMVQILSQLKAFSEVGFQANVTARSKARKPNRKQYFVPRPGSSLPRGVYERYGRGRRKARPVLLFVPLPRYTPRFDIAKVVGRRVERDIERTFSRALGYEMARAGVRNR